MDFYEHLLSVFAVHFSSLTASSGSQEEQEKRLVPNIQTETEAIYYEFCDQEAQEDRHLSMKQRAKLHNTALQCIRNRVGACSESMKEVANVLRVRQPTNMELLSLCPSI